MFLVCVVEAVHFLFEGVEDLAVSSHVRGQDQRDGSLSDLFEGLGVEVGEDVAVGLREDLEGHGTVMVLQRRDVVVTNRQLGSGVDLIPERERERGMRTIEDNKTKTRREEDDEERGGGGE